MDEAGVVDDLRAEGCRIQQVCEIARAADLAELAVTLEMLAQSDAVGDAAVGDQAVEDLENRSVGGRIEVARLQDVGHALMRVVIKQDCAQHSHFGLQVMRGRQLLRRFVVFRHGLSLGQSSL